MVIGFSDIPLQKMVQQTMGVGRGYRAYNPSIVSYHGKVYLFARVSDYTVCPEEFHINKSLAVKNAFHSHVSPFISDPFWPESWKVTCRQSCLLRLYCIVDSHD